MVMEHEQDGNKNFGDKYDKPIRDRLIAEQLEENSRYRDSPAQETVFYYSRERRLARASEAVRAINEPGPAMRGGVLRVFFATRSGTLLFVTVVILCVFMLFLYYTRGRPDMKIGGNSISISALYYAGKTYVEIKKRALENDCYTGTVDLALSIPQKFMEGETSAPVVNQEIFFTLEEDEGFRFSLPFDALRLVILMRAGNEVKTFRVDIERDPKGK
jgi:hypothetical protein